MSEATQASTRPVVVNTLSKYVWHRRVMVGRDMIKSSNNIQQQNHWVHGPLLMAPCGMWHLVEREWLLIASTVSALVPPQPFAPGLLIHAHQLFNLPMGWPYHLQSWLWWKETQNLSGMEQFPVPSNVLFPIVHLNTPVHIASTVSWIKGIKPWFYPYQMQNHLNYGQVSWRP